MADAAPPRVVLTDIEGTTTPIAFVHETLFPFAEAALADFLAASREWPEVARILEAVPGEDQLATLRGWMARDAKEGPLKALQGMIWRQGYAEGRLRGRLWPDVAPALRRWASAGRRLAVYSSGSEEAQRLLFRHSDAGDLEGLFEAFFDTRVGPKREAASYARIAATLAERPDAILFLSDVAEELDAAREAGLRAAQLVRPGDGTLPCPRHAAARDFAELSRSHGLPAPEAAV